MDYARRRTRAAKVIKGSSLMGGAVEESFSWTDGKARWKSQADAGEAASATAPLYVVNDDSPWPIYPQRLHPSHPGGRPGRRALACRSRLWRDQTRHPGRSEAESRDDEVRMAC
ncbi:hypothetical protein [Caulobacter sp.]|uniref:hypothetical protein n=1 Tax=Caulobacter sp. TaxID=78 RepID=UPI001B20D996|nr:hypothetical protein [Caulobacter sp.]MBO9545257.1 hypothetical protein [Caulobacter sp.]